MGCAVSTSSKDRDVIISIDTINNEYDENVVLEWKAKFPTQKYHWWPQKEIVKDKEDPRNNLFALGGGLDKYDKLFNTNSIEYQKENHCIPFDSDRSDKNWAGFCDRASSLSCLFKYPKNSVTVKFKGKETEFSPKDIEALLIVASDNTTRDGLSVFYGSRNNMKKNKENTKIYSHVKSEPFPLELLEVLKRFSYEEEPFVMDIDNGSAVWNYPFDSFKVTREPILLEEHKIPKDGKTVLYKFKFESVAYANKNMEILGYVNYNGEHIRQKWLSKKNPDFLWKEYPRLDPWDGMSNMNPHIDSYKVYRIYQQSICKNNKYITFV